MKIAALVVLALLAAPLSHAQDASPVSTPAHALDQKTGLPLLLTRKAATPAPTPVAAPPIPPAVIAEPQTSDQFLQLLLVVAQAWQVAATLGSLTAYLFASLATTYALLFLVKGALKQNLPEHYKKILRPLLVILAAVAAGLGYYIAGPAGAIATGAGAGSSALLHDVVDALRYGPKKKG